MLQTWGTCRGIIGKIIGTHTKDPNYDWNKKNSNFWKIIM